MVADAAADAAADVVADVVIDVKAIEFDTLHKVSDSHFSVCVINLVLIHAHQSALL